MTEGLWVLLATCVVVFAFGILFFRSGVRDIVYTSKYHLWDFRIGSIVVGVCAVYYGFVMLFGKVLPGIRGLLP